MDEMKTRSIRATDAVLERFKAIAEQYPNQSEALDQMVSAWETQNAKAVLHGMETDISDFESHLKAIQSAFLHILEINANTEDRIRTEFQNLITSKDQTIIDLQNQLNTAEQERAEAEQRATNAEEQATATEKTTAAELSAMRDRLTNAERAEATAKEQYADKVSIIEALNRQVKELSNTVEQAKTAEQRATTAEARATAAESKIKELERQLQEQIRTAEQSAELAKAKAEADKQTAINEVTKSLNDEIKQLMREKADLIAKAHKRKKAETTEDTETAINPDQLSFDS